MLNRPNILRENAQFHPAASAARPITMEGVVRRPIGKVESVVQRRIPCRTLSCKTCLGKCCVGRCRF